jgi:hypothetical protein
LSKRQCGTLHGFAWALINGFSKKKKRKKKKKNNNLGSYAWIWQE